jgi:hypothetical protein
MIGLKFTIRLPLALMTLVGVICLVAVFAGKGHAWAIAIITTVFAAVFGFLTYVLFFVVAWVFSTIVGRFEKKQPRSPFAQDQPPPQIVPPEGPL